MSMMGNPSGGGTSSGDGGFFSGLMNIMSAIQQGVIAINNLTNAVRSVFPQQASGTSTSASGGSASALPAQPVSYLTITLPDGTTGKVPVYG